jgi:hypothetical protein
LTRQNDFLLFVANFDLFDVLTDFNRRTLCLNQRAVIQRITDPFYHRLKSDEVEHHTGTV